MKKLLICLAILLMLALAVYFFWDPILDFLPIDQSGWTERDGNHYLLDEDGDPRTGWIELEEGLYYFREDGAMHTGWLEEGEDLRYFDAQGHMVSGWQNIQGKKYCFTQDGILRHGFLEEDGKRFYLDDQGNPASGFFSQGDITYFVLDGGSILSGWLQLSEGTYYLDETGAVHTGWLEDSGSRFYMDEIDGHMRTGWLETDEGSYYLLSNGALATGLNEIDGVLYHLDESGLPCSGWEEINGQRYYFGDNGNLYTGWLEYEGMKYYLKEDGTPAVGRVVIDEQTYFFSSTGMNFIMVNPWNSLPQGFEPNLVEMNGVRLDPACQEALEKMLADCRAAGFSPVIVSSYRSIADQQANLNRMVKSYQDDGYSYSQAYAAATQIVAVPGTSEHHLGLAFDIVDSAHMKLNYQQAQMPTQKWLMEHCWEYGFILRYPENTTDITGIIWEPWHYRYVGVELALEIRDLGGIPLEVYLDNLTNDGTTCGGKLVILE